MASERWSIDVQKDYLKFSAAHFLVFPDGTAERLHGHNYKVYAEIESGLDAFGLVLNFKDVKPLIRALVDELDERLLIPGKHPVLTCVAQGDGSTEIRYRERRYVVPTDEVIVLPINNTSAENLATFVGRELKRRIVAKHPHVVVRRLRIAVEETAGQRGIYEWNADGDDG